jgi:AcrR family transcriptional regulator
MSVTQRRTEKDIIQKRAIETRDKILVAALELYTEKGYHNTTVDEISKRAGMSTGIAYRYFKNKKAILLAALTYAFENIRNIAGVSETDIFGQSLADALTAFEEIHIKYYAFHEELEGLKHSDEDVKKLCEDFSKIAIRGVYDSLPEVLRNRPHSWEKLNMAIGMMENYCHLYMDKQMTEEELRYIKDSVIKITEELLTAD